MTVKNTKKFSTVAAAVSPALLAALLLFLQACAGEPPTIPEEPSSPPKPPLVFQAGHADPISAASSLGGGSHLLTTSAGTIKLWHSDGRLRRSLEASTSFTPLSDRRRFAWLPADRRSIMISEFRETPPRLIFESAESLDTLAAGPAGLLLTGPGERETGTLLLLDDRSGELKARIGRKGGLFPLSQPVFSPDGAVLLFSSRASLPEDKGRDPLLLYRLSASVAPGAPAEPSALYPRFAGENETVTAVHFLAPDILLLLGSRGTATAFRLSSDDALEPLWEFDETTVRSAVVEPGGSRLALSLENGSAALYRFPDSSAVSRLEKPRLYRSIREAPAPLLFPEEGGYLYFADGSDGSDGSGRLTVYDDEEGRVLFTFPGPADPILGVEIDEAEERIRVLRPDRVDLLDYAGILRDRLPPREADSRVSAPAATAVVSAGLSVEASPEGILNIRRTVGSDASDASGASAPSGSAEISTAARDGEWISWDINGNYAGSRDAGTLLGTAGDGGLHYIGQAASHFNAPDRLLELMQAGTSEEIGYYRKLLRDRDRELDRQPNQNIPLEELHPPRVEISAASSRRITDMKQAMTISFDIQAGAFPVRNYQIHVNGVPLYPWPGKPVTSMQVEEEIILYETLNRVEVSCTDSRNVRSNSPFRYGYVKKAKAGDAYYVGFGVSDYDDDSLDLSFAAKDVSDLLIYFENVVFERSFAVTHKAYTDSEVGPDAFAEANRFLRDATGDDTVVIFLAGHVHHAESESGAGFYLLPASAELADIPATSIPFSALERIFDGVPARRRLLLLDTDRAPLSADRDRAIHHQPGCSSGAIIYSSTGGSGGALESGDLKNGLFAESLLQVLVDKRSDRNRNNYIDRRELTGAVTRRVVELSDRRQQPVLLRDNPLSPIFLPIVTDFGVDIGSLLRASDASW